jgi:uncharacterized surface protein with fasciclin (FAS1) repeats
MSTTKKQAKTIVDIATSDKNFSTLVQALQAGDLVDTLKGKGPFTVFAPTNDAFEALSEKSLKDLMKPANKARLQKILKHHVVKGRRMAADVAGQSALAPLSGETMSIRSKKDQVRIGNATIQQTDIEAGNGVVHVIDQVLMP